MLYYVNDILIASSSAEEIKEFKQKIKQRYKTNKITEIKRFVGININQTVDYITISHQKAFKYQWTGNGKA